MIQKPKPTSVYQSEILEALAATGIKQTSPGGKARAFCDIVGDKLGEIETRQYVNLTQTLLPYATGKSLDFLGEVLGVRRIPRQDVVVQSTENNFQFSVRRGTFGSVNGGSAITIPAGTRIFTDSDTGPVYITDAELTLASGSSAQTFAATSLSLGSAGNAPSGVFTRHNFTNYEESRFGSLLVTNIFGVVGGRDEEDDESYRYRINLKIHSQGGASENDLRLAVLQIPGIQDVVFKREAGTFTAFVYGISPNIPPSLLQLVQNEIDERTAYPLAGIAVAPDLVGFSLSTKIKVSSTVSTADQSGVLSLAAQAAEDYINNLQVGQSLVINEIADRILNADQRIVDIGEPNRPLQEIFIWRSRSDASRYSRFLISNYSPQLGERIVVEDLVNSINLSIG
jgi:uncharacterized phage protein gp47/JayE